MNNAMELLSSAVATAASESGSEIHEKCSRVRDALASYEKLSTELAHYDSVGKMLAAVGRTPPGNGTLLQALEVSTSDLKQSFSALWETSPAVPVSSVQVISKESPPVSSFRSRVTLEPTPEDLATATKIIREVETLAQTDLSRESVMRLTLLLQALTAEARILVERIPQHHPMCRSLIQSFRTIANIKEDRGISTFINGLGREAKGNWERIAITSRKRVESIDQAIDTPKPQSKVRPLHPNSPDALEGRFPTLASRTKEQPLMIVGGVRVQEKLDYLEKKFGVLAEWYETEKSTPKATQSAVERIKRKKTPGVIVLESFMAHSTFDALKTACNSVKLPFAQADRAGQSSLEMALMSLETRQTV